MPKVLELLEKHCQWIAIGVAGLVVILAAWKFVLVNPVQMDLTSNKTVTAGTVDDEVKAVADQLDGLIKGGKSAKAINPPEAVNPRTVWSNTLEGANTKLTNSALLFPSVATHIDLKDTNVAIAANVQVVALPTLPPAVTAAINQGKALATIPAVAVPAGALAPMPAKEDIQWVCIQFDINAASIGQSFTAVSIPQTMGSTSILAVELWREELLPNNQWAQATKVPRLRNSEPILSLPVLENNNFTKYIADTSAFRGWAETNSTTATLMQPKFYEYTSGDGPFDAAKPAVTPPAIQPPVQPQPVVPQPVNPRPPRPTPPSKRSAGGGGRPGRGAGGENAAHDDRPSDNGLYSGMQLAQVRPGGIFGDPPIRAFPTEPGIPPSEAGIPGVGGPVTPGQPPVAGLPQGQFLPQTVIPPQMHGWLFDETAKPSSTYRYQVRYCLRNPLFGVNIAVEPIQKTFEVWSNLDPNFWSQDITIPDVVKFWLAGQPFGPSANSVQFEVYRWNKGAWTHKKFAASPGDQVGAKDGDVDFSTGYTLVDIRYDARTEQRTAVLLAPNGKLITRDLKSDRDDSERASLTQPAFPGGTTPGSPTPPIDNPPSPVPNDPNGIR